MKKELPSNRKSCYDKEFVLGILGGGQLGRMLIQEAIDLDVKVAVLDPASDAPCADICHSFVCGSFNDFDTVYKFGQGKDVLTIEIENVNTEALEALEKEGVVVLPSSGVLKMVKDKGLQKQFYALNGIPSADFILIEDKSGINDSRFEFPMVQKLRTGGYDGRGVQILRNEADCIKAFDKPSVLEKAVDIEKELSVIVARGISGETSVFPVVELIFDPAANLVDVLLAPARISPHTEAKAIEIALRVVEKANFVGLLAVELFLTPAGEILVNEIAPRPHNSGHHTIEANFASQYGQHLRAILDLPLGRPEAHCPAAMVNLLGAAGHEGPVLYQGLEAVLSVPAAYVHLYGKSNTKPYRKMGHVTVLAKTVEEALLSALYIKDCVKVLSKI